MVSIETERLMLRQMHINDIGNLMKIFSDPIAMQYYTSTKTREDAEKWISWNLSNYEKIGVGLWICELKDDNTFVGQCGIIPQVVDGENELEIGYLFTREYWGKGYATEAAIASKNYGFEKLRAKRLISMIRHNIPSVRVAERIGMVFEKETLIKNRKTYIYAVNR
ncbi:GNAT family N-acetyltransferase [Litchfieldia alkalitelluris]|uniref:GNAT family N-acetyltransferase n=1 Tax=Litchfieldia alkalitelluris TaxID=304268 RepID=UPI000997FF1D|nr:GNAT family N-acetyltransferase [Litchfieldia alkalitelluris]